MRIRKEVSSIEILNRFYRKDDWFLKEQQRSNGDSGYPIDYALVICRALSRSNLVMSGRTQECLNTLKNAIKHGRFYAEETFLKAYPFDLNGCQEKAFVIIDASHSIFPLIIYPDSYDGTKKEDRKKAFLYRIDQVLNKFTQLGPLLSSEDADAWDKNFQGQLSKILPSHHEKKLQKT